MISRGSEKQNPIHLISRHHVPIRDEDLWNIGSITELFALYPNVLVL